MKKILINLALLLALILINPINSYAKEINYSNELSLTNVNSVNTYSGTNNLISIRHSLEDDKYYKNCKDTFLGDPEDTKSVAWLIQHLLNYLKILAPMIVLVLSGIDFAKAIISGDDEVLQKCYKRLITRLILALALFFVPDIVKMLLEIFGLMGDPICVLK